MKIGLVGLNQTGKSTLFNLLTGKENNDNLSISKGAANIGSCTVPDERIDFLSELYKPKKTTYAKIEITDIAGFAVSDDSHSSGASRFLNDLRPCDALVHVLRAFESDSVVHDSGSINPARDLEAVETEMLFADLEMIEKRIGRIKAGKKITKELETEINLLKKCFDRLEKGGSIFDMELTEQERVFTRQFAFLTEKPRLAVINLGELEWESKNYPNDDELKALCKKISIPLLELCVDMELEISRLPQDDKLPFMEDMGITESGISALAQAAYNLMGLISFITVGEDEVRAWTIEKGLIARSAAGKIHSDIERGFIRAEVVKYSDLHELGSMPKVKDKGLFRLEGKEYIVNDGDIINFRFNV
ncbi:MAG: redox-regulated ATPase YchF [Oscillospiraceae bacterium]|nr:redox-regulated ATPase YchF [Oscillospiraceae bacterium]